MYIYTPYYCYYSVPVTRSGCLATELDSITQITRLSTSSVNIHQVQELLIGPYRQWRRHHEVAKPVMRCLVHSYGFSLRMKFLLGSDIPGTHKPPHCCPPNFHDLSIAWFDTQVLIPRRQNVIWLRLAAHDNDCFLK